MQLQQTQWLQLGMLANKVIHCKLRDHDQRDSRWTNIHAGGTHSIFRCGNVKYDENGDLGVSVLTIINISEHGVRTRKTGSLTLCKQCTVVLECNNTISTKLERGKRTRLTKLRFGWVLTTPRTLADTTSHCKMAYPPILGRARYLNIL